MRLLLSHGIQAQSLQKARERVVAGEVDDQFAAAVGFADDLDRRVQVPRRRGGRSRSGDNQCGGLKLIEIGRASCRERV